MRKILDLILAVLFISGILAPSVLAAKEPNLSVIVDMGSRKGSDSDILSGKVNSIAASDGIKDKTVPDDFDYTGCIISFTTPAAIDVLFNMNCGDTDFSQLHNALDSVAISGKVEKDATTYDISMTVTWDFSTVDAETPSNYTAIGRICVPDGATLSGGLKNTVSIWVNVTAPVPTVSPSAIILSSFDEPYRMDAVAFAVGTSQGEIADWFDEVITGFIGYDDDGNYYELISGQWSIDAVNAFTPGVYFASTTPDLGTEYTLAKDISLPQQLCAVSIQTPGEPDINCCVSGRGFLHFPWILSAEQKEQLDEFAVWLRQDDEEWTSLSDGFWFTTEDFQLSQRILQNDSHYELKVTYPGGQTGILYFQYDGALSILDYSSGDRDGGDVNGNGSGAGTQPSLPHPQTPSDSGEDGNTNSGNNNPAKDHLSSALDEPDEEHDPTSDSNLLNPAALQASNNFQNIDNSNDDNGIPAYSPIEDMSVTGDSNSSNQVAVPVYTDVFLSNKEEDASTKQRNNGANRVMNPMLKDNDTPSENSGYQESTTVTESYSPTQTIISGMRLRELCKEEESVVFGSGNLTVSIPSKLLLALNLSASDTLTINLTQPKSNQIMLTVEASGKSVKDLTGTVLRYRYTPQSENAEITVQNEACKYIKDASFDGELLRFRADTAGIYTVLEVSKAQEKQKAMSPLLAVSGVLILAAGGITFFRRRRHG